MNGAREYAELFGVSHQHGKLYIKVGSHARGKTFELYVTPTDCAVCLGSEMIEVYGITSGQPGWTETYGWLRKGPWEADFAKLVEEAKAEKLVLATENKARKDALAEEREAKAKAILSAYRQAAG